MKKFFSLMLAVLLLVSALPFAAFATEVGSADFWIQLNAGTEGIDSKLFTMPADANGDVAADYARVDAEFGAYFTQYGNDYTVAQTAPNAFLITFAVDTDPEEPTQPEPTTEPTQPEPTTEPTQPEPTTEPTQPEDPTHALKFNYKNANGTWTSSIVSVKVGDRINAPEVPSVSGLKHTGWDNNLQDGWTRWYIGMPTEFTATYVESTDDGLVDLTVYAYYYVDGEYHHKAKLFVEEFKESKHNNMVPWIYSEGISEVKTALAAEHGADGYQWNPTVFYNCYGDGEISMWDDLKADGNKAVYVKINSKKAIEATILLHIHTAKEYAIARTVKMPGYTAGDFVSYNDALAKVKNYYTGSKLEMSDLYDENDWDDLMDGLKSSGSKTIKVEDNGTTEIHVIVKNATSKTSSNADPSNPKTGDSIMIAVGTMAMAAAALVTLAELKKRKMI